MRKSYYSNARVSWCEVHTIYLKNIEYILCGNVNVSLIILRNNNVVLSGLNDGGIFETQRLLIYLCQSQPSANSTFIGCLSQPNFAFGCRKTTAEKNEDNIERINSKKNRQPPNSKLQMFIFRIFWRQFITVLTLFVRHHVLESPCSQFCLSVIHFLQWIIPNTGKPVSCSGR